MGAASKELTQIHNDSYRAAIDAIIRPTYVAGGKDGDIMVVLESTIVGVLLACYGNPRHAGYCFDMLQLRVIDRLTSQHGKITQTIWGPASPQ